MSHVVATGELRPGGSGSVSIGPAEYVLEWWANTPPDNATSSLLLRVRVGRRPVGEGELVKHTDLHTGEFWAGEVLAEGIRYWCCGRAEGAGKDRTLRLEWSAPRAPLHERPHMPEWASAFVAPAPEIAE